MLSNTGSTESVVKYIVYRWPAIAAILFYWITMKSCPTADSFNIGMSNGLAY